MTMNREPGELCRITMCVFVLIIFVLHFAVLIVPYSVSPGLFYWRIVGAIICLLALLSCLLVFSMHRQFRGSRPNLFRVGYVN